MHYRAMNFLNLHTRSDRAAFFAEGKGRPVVFDKACQRWIVADGAQVIELLKDSRLISPNIAAGLDRLQRRFGVQLPNLIFAAGCIPLINEGAAHGEMRRSMSHCLGDHRKRMEAAAGELVERHFSILDGRSEVELIGETLAPFVAEVFSILTQTDEAPAFVPQDATRIFDHWASLNALLAAEVAIGTIRRGLEPLFRRGIPREQEGVYLALTILGRDSLLATLGDSLATLIADSAGRCLSEIEYPAHPPETGVAIAERQATESFAYDGVTFRKGDWLRLYFQGVTYGHGAAKGALMFGAGPHACLGRHLALDLWGAIAGKLASIHRRAEIVEFAYCDNHVFAMPRTVRLELHR